MTTPFRIQTRPVKLGAGNTNFSDSFASLPAVGSYITIAQTSGGTTTTGDTVTDNQSPPNTYVQKVSQTGVAFWAGWVTTSAGTFTLTLNGTHSSGNAFEMIEWGGVDPTTPIDGTPGTATQAGFSFTSLTCSAGTSTQPNDVLLLLSQTGTSGNTPTYSGNMSLLVSDVTNGASSTLSLGQGTVGSIGAQTGSVSWPSATNYDAVAMLLKGVPEPTITSQPTSVVIHLGDTATFTVSATASAGSLSYQWQDNSTGSFANITGATSASYTTGTLGYGDNATVRQCVISDSNSSVTSNQVTALVDFNVSGTMKGNFVGVFGGFPFAGGAFGGYSQKTPSGGSTTNKTLSAGTTTGAVSVHGVQVIRKATSTAAALIVRQARRTVSASSSTLSLMVRTTSATKSAATTLLASMATIKTKLVTLSASVTSSAITVRGVQAVRIGVITCTAILSRTMSVVRSAVTTVGALTSKQISIARAASTTIVAALATVKARLLTLSASTAIVGSTIRSTIRALIATATASTSTSKLVKITKLASTTGLALEAAFAGLRTLTLSAATSVTGSLVRSISTVRAASTTISAITVRSVRILRSAAASVQASQAKTAILTKSASTIVFASFSALKAKLLTLSASVTSAATLKRNVFAIRTASATVVASALKAITHTLAAATTVLGMRVASLSKSFAASTTALAALTQSRIKILVLLASLASGALLNRTVQATRTAGTVVAGTVTKFIAKTFASASSIVGTLSFGARTVFLTLSASTAVSASLHLVSGIVSTVLRIYRFLFESRIYRFSNDTRIFSFAADQRTFRFDSDGSRVFRFPFPGV